MEDVEDGIRTHADQEVNGLSMVKIWVYYGQLGHYQVGFYCLPEFSAFLLRLCRIITALRRQVPDE